MKMSDIQTETDEGSSKSTQRLKPKIEDDEDIRMYAALSFAVLLIAVGVPLWWKTTEVYRVHVPYGHIAEIQEKELFFNVNVHVHSSHNRTGSLEDAANEFSWGPLRINFFHYELNESSSIGSADSLLKLEEIPTFQSDKPGDLIFTEVPQLSELTESDIVVGSRRTIYFSPKSYDFQLLYVLRSSLLQSDSLQHTLESMQSPFRPQMQDATARRRVPPSTQYDLMITVVHPEPDRRTIIWDLESVVQDQLSPLLAALSPVSQLRVKSQWLYLVKLFKFEKIRPKQVVSQNETWYALSQEALSDVITPLEKKLGTSVSNNPSIQLVLYIPPCNWSPLHIVRSFTNPFKDSENAFLSPRWGGIQIYNPPVETCLETSESLGQHTPDAATIMSVFRKQLKLLLGVHTLEPLLGVDQLPLPQNSLRLWELDILLRTRTLEQITSAKLTLKSLAQLLEEMNNIVITEEVGECIWEAIRSVNSAMESLHRDDLVSAFNASQRAFVNAETAFTDPSLLALLYFPEDQKYAVYIPLFLPIMIPVLMSLRSIFTWLFRGKRKEKKD